MKLPLFVFGIATLSLGWIASDQPAKDVVVIVGGDVHGYLSPCGCTKPMTGGIRRRATAIRNMTAGKASLILENGGLVKGGGRQDEMKAETLAEALKFMGADAIHFTSTEAALGRGVTESIARLCGAKLTSASLANDRALPIAPYISAKGFLVGGVSLRAAELARHAEDRPAELADALDGLVIRAKQLRLPLVLMVEGRETDARTVAAMTPEAKLIVYSTSGDPAPSPIQIGDQVLVSPGEHGKSLIRLRYTKGAFQNYTVVKLTPEYADDAKVLGVYTRYLDRVTDEHLLEKMPRKKGSKFAGNPTCGSCHADAMLTWEKSRHAGALHSLEIEKHDRDPDCTGCHVVGLEYEKGFQSRRLTPHLTDVGCESCHGAGGDHSTNPTAYPMLKIGEESCRSCHVKDHSPEFDFATYWKKIRH